jgi:hypothetical protein
MPPSRHEEAEPRDGNGGTPLATSTVPRKNNQLLYAAGDVIVWVGTPNVGAPTGFEDPTTITAGSYRCLGWVDTSGYIFKLDETVKDIPAAGQLTPIRTILTGGVKTVQQTFMEGTNPQVISLYDDVPVLPVTTSPYKPPTPATAPYVASVVIPDPPYDNRYSFIWDSIDSAKAMRLYAPYGKVTARGNYQVQQADVTMVDMTITCYQGTINDGTDPAVQGVLKRIINYGQDTTAYFT